MDNTQKAILGQTNQIDYNKRISLTIRYNNFPRLSGGLSEISINDAVTKIKNNILRQLNVPERYKDATLENYDKKADLKSFNTFKSVLDNNFLNKDGELVSMLLWSNGIPGNGKTHLLYAAAKKYTQSEKVIEICADNPDNVTVSYKNSPICILTEYDFLNRIRDTFKSNSELSEGDVFDELNRYKILCLDDLVKYVPSNIDFYQRVMFQLVNERYNNKTSLIVTTNKTLVQLAEFLGVATADRLCDMSAGYQLEFKGASHRAKPDNTKS